MRVGTFVGRAAELAAIRDELVRARRRSRVVILTGAAGAGKTRLLEEARRRLGRQARWLVGRGSPISTTLSYAPVVEAVESFLVGADAALVRQLAAAHQPLAGHMPILHGGTDPAASPAAVFGAFRSLFAMIADSQSSAVVLALDDMHQADRSSWDLLSYLARNPITAPVLALVVCRDEAIAADIDLAQWLDALVKDGLADRIELPPLADEELTELAARTVGADRASSEFVMWLVERSRGNALFATAILSDYLADPHRRAVPDSVRERTRLVLSGLPAPARSALEAAAVLGQRFDLEALSSLVGPTELAWLDELARRGLLSEPSDPNGSYDFTHPLVQEAIYDAMGIVRRRTLHLQAAAALRNERLPVRAYHAARGASHGDAHAIDLVVQAAREAEGSQLHRQAVTHLQAALALVDVPDERAPLLDELAWQAGCVADHVVGIPALRELELLVDEPLTAGSVQMRLASFLAWGEGDLRAAETAARTAIQQFTIANAVERVAAAVNELAWVLGADGDVAAQITNARTALEQARREGAAETELHTLGTLGHALAVAGHVHEAITTLDAGRDLAVGLADGAQQEWFAAVRIEAEIGFGRVSAAQQVLEEHQEIRREPIDLLPSRQALLAWYRGNWPNATSACDVAEALNPIAQPIHSAWSLALGGVIATLTGRPAHAQTLVARGDRIYRHRRIYWMSARHEWLAGIVAWLGGDTDAARSRILGAAEWARELGAVVVEAEILPDLIEVLALRGEHDHAGVHAARFEEIAETFDAPLWTAQLNYVKALARGGAEAPDRFIAAANAFDDAETPYLAARAWEHAGNNNVGTAGLDALTRAARLYHSLGALDLEQRVRQALRSHGHRGTKSARALGGLTPRERDVLALARSDLTAKEIAAQLHVGERTVETHLANLYRKLGVQNRRQLRAAEPPSD